jgi:procollagen-lysine,2-oxoglutarate 5-dioxygenase 1
LAVYLNNDFEGGGTIFPRWNVGTARETPGTALIFPGGLSHVHQGLPISSGVRYLLCGAFF